MTAGITGYGSYIPRLRLSRQDFTAWMMCWVSATPAEESAAPSAECALTRRSIVTT